MSLVQEFNNIRNNAIENFNLKSLLSEIEKIKNKPSILDMLSFDLQNENEHNSTVDYISNKDSSYIGGYFDCSYNPSLILELGQSQEVKPSIILPSEISFAKSVNLSEATDGLKSEKVVALFPENFKDHTAKESDVSFYFINKFASRHKKYTRRVFSKFFENSSELWAPIHNLSSQDLEALVANWVHLHEFFHRTGEMPLTNYLYEKSCLQTAAIEELRADLLSMKYCLDKSKDRNDCLYYKTFLYILSERLFSYIFYRDLSKDSDAISSIIFCDEFINEGIVNIKNDEIRIISEQAIYNGVNALIQKISDYEKKFSSRSLSKEERKKEMKKHVSIWLLDASKTKLELERLKEKYYE